MNIEKIKKALNLAMREHNDLMLQADLPTGSKVFEEALAELEKPVDDYDISESASDIFSNADSWFIGYNKIKQIIQKCAESYHAKKCAECQKVKESL